MINPARILVKQFVGRAPQTVLLISTLVSLADFIALFTAADADGVLVIPNGVGLWQEHGLLSMILGNCFVPLLTKLYFDTVRSIAASKAVQDVSIIEAPLASLLSMMRLTGRYARFLYLLIFVGLLYWLANTGIHLFGNVEVRWGHKVFDSTDHRFSFYASRLHNFYTWLIVLPVCGHVVFFASLQLRRLILLAFKKHALRYDLLNPDQHGGFRFVEKAQVIFNVLVAIIYVQITLHIQTFERMNAEHIIAYVVMTLLMIIGNQIFLYDINVLISNLKEAALNETKERVYKNDKLSFDILKYCYDQRIDAFSLLNVVTKISAIVIPIGTKLMPLVSKMVI